MPTNPEVSGVSRDPIMRVALVDPDWERRDAVRRVFPAQEGLVVVEYGSLPPNLEDLARELARGYFFVMIGINGHEDTVALAEILGARGACVVACYTAKRDFHQMTRLMRAGVRELFTLPLDPEELSSALKRTAVLSTCPASPPPARRVDDDEVDHKRRKGLSIHGGPGIFDVMLSVVGMFHRMAAAPEAPAPVRASTPATAPAGAAVVPGESRTNSPTRVDFSVYAPHPVKPGSSFLINIWANLPEQRAEMLERAAGPGEKVEVGSRGGILLPAETPLFLALRLDRFKIDNPMEPFEWRGQVTNVSFLVSVPGDLSPATYPGQIGLLRNGMLIGKFYFEIVVSAATTSAPDPPVTQAKLRPEWVRSAFASYSSHDRDKVVQRVQGITATGVDVFLDVASLRTGGDWQQQLLRAIETRDIFYLFWSRFAKASEHVEREWRVALEKKGIHFIHPIPLEDPQTVPPPGELSRLDFHDIYLSILKASAPGESAASGSA